MASEIRVNSLSSRAGLSTVTFTDTGPIFSGITTFQDNSGFNVGTGGSIFSPASNTVTLGTNSAERLRITSDGKIGVNNTSPLSDLQVITAGQTEDGTFRIGGSAAALGLVFDYDQSGATVSKITANPTYTNTSSLLKICVDGDANPDQLVLKGDGNIGVGVANPSQKFMVKGIIASEATNSTNNWMAYTYTDDTFRLNYNGAGDDEVVVTSGGNISVGGATGRDFSLLDGIVTNTANGSAGLLINSSSSSHNAYLGFSYGSGSSTSHADQFSAYIGRVGDNTLILGTNNNIRLRITSSGNVAIGHNSAPTKLGIRGTSASTDATVQIVGNGVSTLLLGQDAGGGVIRGQGGSNQIKFKVGGNGDDAATTGGIEAARFNSSGNLVFPSGQGIDFSANAHASQMSSEILDDYEEGTWTPDTGGVTWNSQAGTYTKVGNLVNLNFWLQASGTSSSTGGFSITGLPFANTNSANVRPTGAVRLYSPQNFSSNSGVTAWMSQNSSNIELSVIDSNGVTTATPLNHNIWRNGAEVHCTMTYQTDS